jgi:hypothetical protein
MLSTDLMLKFLLVLLALGLLAVLALLFSQLQQRRIYQWANENRYALLKLHFVRHAGGLLFWLPLVQRGTWQITVEDEQGGRRSGWVYFGPWWMECPWGKLHVQWR